MVDPTLNGMYPIKSLSRLADIIDMCVQIEAHVGSVNDLAFSYPNKQLCIVTCGEDRLIKGAIPLTRTDENFTPWEMEQKAAELAYFLRVPIEFIFSTNTDGKIKAWLYATIGSRVDYTAPGYSSAKMAYSANGTRLFSCGTNKEGDSYIVEWNEREGFIKHTYEGLKLSAEVVQFHTARIGFLLLVTSASPCIRYGKEGNLLAVSTNEYGIKILGNTDGIRPLRTMDNRAFDASRIASASAVKVETPMTSMFGAANTSVGQNILDRATPMPSTVMMLHYRSRMSTKMIFWTCLKDLAFQGTIATLDSSIYTL
ncbi:topless-related protein 4-like protein isoform X1 [Tanacetum coccineum]